MSTLLRIAIQKSGRLQEGSLKLLQESGLSFSHGKDQLKALARNFPVEILFLRDDDIPQYIEDGVADVGIVGENVFVEKQKQNRIIKRLDFCKNAGCRSPFRAMRITAAFHPRGKNVATSYPFIVSQYLAAKGVKAGIHEISGSVEIAPGIGLADAICDLVSSGSTLLSNGLKEVEIVMQSEAVLIGNNKPQNGKEAILNKLLFRIDAVQSAKNNKYILLNCPNDAIEKITNILPELRA